MGENVVELILEYSGALAKGEHKSSEEVKMVFWDFLGIVMVCACYTFLSLWLHAESDFEWTDEERIWGCRKH